MLISISRYLAIALGILTPLAETIRRWSTWRQNPASFFDDYILGAFLLFGAWRTGKDVRRGRPFLAAAWAFMCGMAYNSFFGQLEANRLGLTDPAPISSGSVAAIKGIGLAVGIICLVFSLWPLSEKRDLYT
ncbi:MAG TPA: hypothetical protein VHP99_19305 [Pyrinomonadaceae bacterium]|jgi:hypothetical protein|nr:hypothetical protein [Pyrinomonadaceae bacterium]